MTRDQKTKKRERDDGKEDNANTKKQNKEKKEKDEEKKKRKREKKAATETAAAEAAAAKAAAVAAEAVAAKDAAEAAAAETVAAEAAAAKDAAEAAGTEGEKKEKKKYMRLMLDWRPEFPPEKIYTMTLDQMKAELEAEDSDGGELIDSDAEEEKYEYQGERYTGASIITKFNAEAAKAHERFDAHLKELEGKEGGKAGDKAANSVPRARGAKTKIDQWKTFLHTERTKMSASIYKKYCEHKEIDRDVPVKFKTMQGDHVLKVLEISDADEAARWGKLGPVQEGMVAGEDYY